MNEQTVKRMKKQLRVITGGISACVSELQLPSNGQSGDERERLQRFVEATDSLMSQVLELAEVVARASGEGEMVPDPEIERFVIEPVLMHLADALSSTCALVCTIDKENFLVQAAEMFDGVMGSGGDGGEGSRGEFSRVHYSGKEV